MKVLLINPPTPDNISNKEHYLPSGLLYIASVSVSIEAETKIYDCNTKDIKFVESEIRDFSPDVVGIGCLFSGQFPSVMELASDIKDIDSNIKIIIGGMHPTLYAKEILENCSYIDYVIIGEGENSFGEVLLKLTGFDTDITQPDGIALRHGSEIIVNEQTKYSEVDELPLPAYHLIDIKDYYHDTSEWFNPRGLSINASLPILTSRSCPLRCNFCSMFLVMGPRLRLRSPKMVVDEIQFLYEKYNHRHFSVMDDNFTLNKKHAIEVCNEIVRRNMKIQMETPNGIYTGSVSEEVLDAFVEAGLIRISLAIESGSDYIRKVMGKQLKQEKIYEVAEMTKKYKDLYTRAFFIMGMPEETHETLDETYEMIKDIDVDKPIVSNLLPFPGTELFNQCVKDNLLTDDIDMDGLWSMSGFNFTDNKKFFIKPYKMSLQELDTHRNKFDVLIKESISRKKNERKSGE